MRLSLTTTSLNNCVISNDSDAVFFEIVTPSWEPNNTKIRRLDPNTRELELVAELERSGGMEKDGMTMGGGMKKKGPDAVRLRGEHVFRGKDGKQYRWQEKKRQLQLIRQDEPDKPVATFHRERRYFFVLRMSRQPYLEIQPGCMETLDSLIVSFLLVERKRRGLFGSKDD
ncbi:hypothetical protein SISSUDRAFT_1024350 [Sistotremastrum suecicum HHB10207 ss-3]|uniref:DUF6593 domain-containing protein n=1 Tax=Sistotremastrum suecicum HHB10207 ss-3 TaxID=1314776 RepID=A0A166BG88_9AGAM|nr:hypothetical protein SISSUDRAFT_1024350 [Sistotremastrum suecicum HHB10207 ss-3]